MIKNYFVAKDNNSHWLGDFDKCKDVTLVVNKSFIWAQIPYTAWGDYIGDTVNRANYESLHSDFKEDYRFCFVIGGYDYHVVFVRYNNIEDEDINQIIEGLDDYCLIDDSILCELEIKLQSDSWDSWVKYDLKNALQSVEIDFNPDTLESDFWYNVRFNEYDGYAEDAVSWTWDINKIVSTWGFKTCPSCEKRLNSKYETCESCPRLNL